VKELSDKIASPEPSIITEFDHAKELKRQARRAIVIRITSLVHLVLVAALFVVTTIAWITTQDFGYAAKHGMILLALVHISDATNTFLELNLRPSVSELTRKVSDLPHLLRKAKSVADLHPVDEDKVAGVWNSLSYLTKHLHPHHRREISDETITHLGDLLSTETLSSRLKTLLLIANICANKSLLPSLVSLHERSSEIDQEGTLAGPLASAIEACSRPESQTARAIGGLTQ